MYFALAPYVIAYKVDQDPWFKETSRDFFNRSIATAVMAGFALWPILFLGDTLLNGDLLARRIPNAALLGAFFALWAALFFGIDKRAGGLSSNRLKSPLNIVDAIALISGAASYLAALAAYLMIPAAKGS